MPATRKGKPRKKPGPRTGSVQEGGAAHDLLRYAAMGVLIIGVAGVLAVAPGLAYAAKLFVQKDSSVEDERQRRNRLRVAMKRLEQRKLVRLVEKPEGTQIVITNGGKKALGDTLYDRVRPEYEKAWDGKWRIVMYDIPEERKDVRDSLRRVLDGIGFYQMQQSVYVAPYPCKSEIETVTEFYGVGNYVLYVEAVSLGKHEDNIRHHFKSVQGAKI